MLILLSNINNSITVSKLLQLNKNTKAILVKRHCFVSVWPYLMLAELLWVAPELNKETNIPGHPATQKGDVYSFSIILEEIVVRGGPYEVARQNLTVQGK